jgi:two-component system sensor histidine kinase UhpB
MSDTVTPVPVPGSSENRLAGTDAAPTTARPLNVLLIEDSEDDALLLLHRFRAAGYQVWSQRVEDERSLREALSSRTWDLVLSDHNMPRFSAMAALSILQKLELDLPFIIVSGVIEEDIAVSAMRAGAHDYLSKGKLDRLIPAVEREMREARNRAERHSALDAVRDSEARFRALAANIPGMVFQLLRHEDGGWRFLFVSEGCLALLGFKAGELVAAPRRFLDMILPDDMPELDRAMHLSAHTHATVNWDGRIRLPDEDIKWVNLRSSPRVLASGVLIWEGIVSNITQSKLTERELRQSRGQLAELSSHLQIAKEEERERIARDIHDELGGLLVALKFEVSLLANKTAADPDAIKARSVSMGKLVDDAITTVGRIARELRPGILKEFGLAPAVESHAEDFSARTGLKCELLCIDHDIDPDEETAIALFRVFQEALTNVSKHAGAHTVEVRLTQEDDDIVLEVGDDGRGLAPEDLNKPKSFGLRGIRERVVHLNGRFEASSREHGGTRLLLRVPACRRTVLEFSR